MTKKIKYLFFISAFMFTLSTSIVLAQEQSQTSLPPEKGVGMATITEPEKSLSPEEFKQETSDIRERINQIKENIVETTKIQREQIKQKIETLRENAKQQLENLREKINSEKNQAKAKIKETRIAGREQALEKFDNVVLKVQNSKEKSEAQIAKMEAQGIVIPTLVKDLSITAETKISEAKIKILETSGILTTSANELSKENKAKIVTLTKEIQILINEGQKASSDQVKALKQILNTKIQQSKKIPNQKRLPPAQTPPIQVYTNTSTQPVETPNIVETTQ